MKKFLCSTLICASLIVPVINSTGQTTNAVPPRVEVKEVSVMGGFMVLPSYGNTITMFNQLAPNSNLLSLDLSEFTESSEFPVHTLGVFNTAFSLKFNAKDGSEKRNPLLRLGITYQGGRLLDKSMKYETRTPYDTLTSNQTGTEVYVDSVYSNTIDMKYRTSQVMADIAVIWRSNPDFLLSLYGGLGFAGGISFDNRTIISGWESNYISNGGGYGDRSGESREVFRNKSAYSALAYLPIGAGIRMSKSGFWQNIVFGVEMRPGISIISIPELETYISAVFPVSFGCKVSW